MSQSMEKSLEARPEHSMRLKSTDTTAVGYHTSSPFHSLSLPFWEALQQILPLVTLFDLSWDFFSSSPASSKASNKGVSTLVPQPASAPSPLFSEMPCLGETHSATQRPVGNNPLASACQ
ncbi:hypothetical protein HispidOSU_002335 [Sigmodon hispidus]